MQVRVLCIDLAIVNFYTSARYKQLIELESHEYLRVQLVSFGTQPEMLTKNSNACSSFFSSAAVTSPQFEQPRSQLLVLQHLWLCSETH